MQIIFLLFSNLLFTKVRKIEFGRGSKKAEEEVVLQMKKVEVLDFLKDGAGKELEHAKWELAQMK